jgi:uncharacterized delta-60 repeat protein
MQSPLSRPPRATALTAWRRIRFAAGACALLAAPLDALAASGDLDPTFGTDGVVFADLGGSSARALARQTDGKLVAAGRSVGADDAIAVARFDASGAPDPTFGGDGTVTTDASASDDEGVQVLVQADGKIVVVGRTGDDDEDVVVVRYETDGSLDGGFGTGGIAFTALGTDDDVAFSGALQSDGKILVVGGTASVPGPTQDLFVLRLESDGDLDGTFGSGGLVTLDFGGRRDQGRAVAVQPDGSILVAGTSSNGPLFLDGSVATLSRFNADGSPDATFGTGGSVVLSSEHINLFDAMALQPDGKIVVFGATGPGTVTFRLFRFDGSGVADPGFVGDASPFFTQAITPGSLALRSDGKFLIVGDGDGPGFSVARMNADGSLDESFGMGGDVSVAVGLSGLALATVAEPSGDIVLAGAAAPDVSGVAEMALVRIEGDSALCAVDGDCATCERCGSGGSCEIGPRAACTNAAARKAQLAFRHTFGRGDGLKLVWRGAVPVFDPTVSDDVGVCLYHDGRRILKAVAPAAGTCGSEPCWTDDGGGEFSYGDRAQTPDGIRRLTVDPGRIKVKAKGLELTTSAQGVPNPTTVGPPGPAVVAQVHAGNGACVEATFDTQRRISGKRFAAKND